MTWAAGGDSLYPMAPSPRPKKTQKRAMTIRLNETRAARLHTYCLRLAEQSGKFVSYSDGVSELIDGMDAVAERPAPGSKWQKRPKVTRKTRLRPRARA